MAPEPRRKPRQGTVGVGFTNFMSTARTIFGPSSKPIAPRRAARPLPSSKKGRLPVRAKALPTRKRVLPASPRKFGR